MKAEEFVKGKSVSLVDNGVSYRFGADQYDIVQLLEEYAAPKAVTDGEINLAVIDKAIEDFKASNKWDVVDLDEEIGFPIGFECGVGWMREQQGEGAKERYDKAVKYFVAEYLELGLKLQDFPYTIKALMIASGLTDKQ